MASYLFAFICGNLLALQSPWLLSSTQATVLGIIAVATLCLKKIRCWSYLSLGICNLAIVTNTYLGWQVPIENIHQDYHIVGVVSEKNTKSDKKISFNLLASSINNKNVEVKLRLTWYHPEFPIYPGDKLQLTVRLKPIYGGRNQDGFNYQRWLISEHIQATGYVKAISVLHHGQTWRDIKHNAFWNLNQTFSHGAILYAIATGDKAKLSKNEWSMFRDTGTAHLMAISGLHIGLLFSFTWMFFNLLAKMVGLFFPQIFIQFPLTKLKPMMAMLAVFVSWFYVFYIGASLPTIRASVMLTVIVFCSILSVKLSWLNRLLLAAVIVLIIDPFAPLSVGFWLSFFAVAFICVSLHFMTNAKSDHLVHTENRLVRFINNAKQFAKLQLFLMLWLLPVQWWIFSQSPLLSFPANFIAIPWMSLTVIPLALLGQIIFFVDPTVSAWILTLANELQTWLNHYLLCLLDIEYETTWYFSTHHILPLVFLFILTLCLTLPAKIKLIGLSLLILLMITPNHLYKNWQLTVFDVGQGLAVLIEKNDKAVLYDTGARFPSGYNYYDNVIKPYLLNHNLNLEAVIISHYDNDHAGGLVNIKLDYPNIKVIDTENGQCVYQARFTWLNLDWRVLSPAASDHLTGNNASCVLLVSDGTTRVLLSGDIEKLAEKILVNHLQSDTLFQGVDIATVPHHGSKTSSSTDFIGIISAKHWVISRGLFNRFNHPHPDVLTRLSIASEDVWDTALHGQIQFLIQPNKILIDYYTQSSLLPWWKKSL